MGYSIPNGVFHPTMFKVSATSAKGKKISEIMNRLEFRWYANLENVCF